MRDTLTIKPEMDAAYKAYEALRDEHQRAPKSEKFAMFELSNSGPHYSKWYGPYWSDEHDRWHEAGRLVSQYSWTIVMIFSVDKDDIVHLVSDMKTAIPPREELVQICKDLIASPSRQ